MDLVEKYEMDTLEKWIIKQYAITNSMKKIIEIAAEEEITNNGDPLDHQFILGLINGDTMDELHRVLRLGYRRKVRPGKIRREKFEKRGWGN